MDETTTTSPGVSATQQPSGPATGTQATSGATPEKAALTLEEALKKLSDLEHSNKNASEEVERHRKKLTAYEKKEQEAEAAKRAAEEAQLSEIERTKKQFQDVQSQFDAYKQKTQDRIVRYEIENRAAKLGIIDPEAASALLPRGSLEYDDDGTPTNAEKLLKELIKNKPYLAPAKQEQAQEQAQQQTTPAQTAHLQSSRPPIVPAMNPGRGQIAPPSQFPQGKPVRLSEVWQKQR